MEEYLQIISESQLFRGISREEAVTMLACLDARSQSFEKDAAILMAGDKAEYIGLVLSGHVLVIQEDIWGNRNILSKPGPGQSFATAFACADESVINVNVIAETDTVILKLGVKRVLNVCSSACTHHNRIIHNLLSELAESNLRINAKLTHMGQRSTRAKLMSYFSAEAQQKKSCGFEIPFSRQQLADYLAVDRSGLSAELARMKKDGLIDYHKNRIELRL